MIGCNNTNRKAMQMYVDHVNVYVVDLVEIILLLISDQN